jgi:hypothetical protein
MLLFKCQALVGISRRDAHTLQDLRVALAFFSQKLKIFANRLHAVIRPQNIRCVL